jgi:hypothetical protein
MAYRRLRHLSAEAAAGDIRKALESEPINTTHCENAICFEKMKEEHLEELKEEATGNSILGNFGLSEFGLFSGGARSKDGRA